jgi:hypothetical protein
MQGRPSAGQWPKNPFSVRNTAGRTHRLWSERRVNPAAVRLADCLSEVRPELVSYPETVWAWARAEARCLLLEEWLEEHPLVGEDGVLAPVARYVGWDALDLTEGRLSIRQSLVERQQRASTAK